MGMLIDYKGLSTRLLEEIQTLNSTLRDLNNLFDKSTTSIWQQDQIAAIKALKLRISEEIKREKSAEDDAEYSFNKASVFTGVAGFALGSLIGAIRKSKNPISLGAQLLKQELERQEPFRTLIIALEDGNGLEGVEVVAISRLARESKMIESKVCFALRAKGSILLTPQQFWQVLDNLEMKIMEGKVKPQMHLDKELIEQAKQLNATTNLTE